ncbi:hypothetical protein DYB25_014229 [Aphanomyces astaci]|uniref:Uncharacterized protein n=1 Tax=Aphanomyces astaci TaxID=112090 RepID=A0A397A630_APHAT|nr:hypothetical protein DYB25_014229 [Aphanomyces astaci]
MDRSVDGIPSTQRTSVKRSAAPSDVVMDIVASSWPRLAASPVVCEEAPKSTMTWCRESNTDMAVTTGEL